MATEEAPRFFGYPIPKEGPKVPYQKQDDANPTLRGMPLVIGAWLVAKLPFVQKILYANAGFTSLRRISHLKDYHERWEPTVIPIANGEQTDFDLLDSKAYLPEHTGPTQLYSVAEYHELYLSGKLTPTAVVKAILPLTQRDVANKSHHSTAWIKCFVEEATEAARLSTERYAAGKPLSIFDGVPTGLKDEANVQGHPTTYGRKYNASVFKIEEESSHAAQLFERAGAIILGKLNMHQIGADTTNNNPVWGTPLNPHNNRYYTGGSSGGSAYAVAAGLVPVTLGADGGGSIRIPAAFCGVYGIKPTHHRIDNTHSTVTVIGPIAASMADLTASYRLLSQPKMSDPTCSLFSRSLYSADRGNRKIGYCKAWFKRADPEVFSLCKATVDHFVNKLNYELVDIEIPYLPQGQLAHAFTILAEMATGVQFEPIPGAHYLTEFNPGEKILLGVGSQVTAYDYHLAQRMRSLLMQHLAFLFKQHPDLLIITPTSPMAGWPIDKPGDLTYGVSDANRSIRNMEYVWLANFCGLPCISVPVGYVEPVHSEGKIPVACSAMGEWGAEEQLLKWGFEAEKYLHDVVDGGRVRAKNWEDVFELAKAHMVGDKA